MDESKKKELEKLALRIRIGIAEEIKARGFGHIGGSLSIVDALAVLYGAVMKYDPKNPSWPDRDKLVCSKGHAGPAVYATLAVEGFFPYEKLKTLNQPGTDLPSHCDRNKTPGIDMTTGSLGQGTSLAIGMALGDKLMGRNTRTFLFVGDGEADEGQVWEAAMFTGAKKITNLIWFIDDNKKQLDGYTKDIIQTFDFVEKFHAFGFDAVRVKGDDVEQIYNAIMAPITDRPRAIVLDTIKGRGIADVENTVNNHSMNIKPETGDKWIAELNAELAAL
jgi:transketolase